MREIEQNIDKEIIEKYGENLLFLINNKTDIFKNFLKFSILRYDLISEKFRINNFLRELRKQKNNDVELHNKKQIFELIDAYLGVSEVEKKQNGEVFTPFLLIEEMLDTLPKEVWSNPDLKWLDPANGIGNFPAVVLARLMVGLKDSISNSVERYKHIMENMIYTCDIEDKNSWLYMNIFDPNNELKMNHYQGSFLEEGFDKHMKDVWCVEKFDIVVGNPPYQKPNTSEISKTTQNVKLWRIFLEKSSKITNDLIFVTPSSWASGSKNPNNSTILLKDIFTKHQTNYISLDVNKYFPNIGVDFSYYNISFKENENNTTIKYKTSLSTINLKSIDILPKIDISSILEKINICDKFTFFMDRKDHYKKCLFQEKTDKYNIPVYCGVGKGILFSDAMSPNFNLPKIFTHRISSLKMMNDSNGEISTNYSQVYILQDDENGEYATNLFETKFYKFLYKSFQYTQYNESRTLNQLPKVDLNRSWTDEELYKYFNLTQEEIDLIEKVII